MSKEMAEEYLQRWVMEPVDGLSIDHCRCYGDLRAQEERERIKAQCERDGCYQYVNADQIRQEEREKVLAEAKQTEEPMERDELRCAKAEAFIYRSKRTLEQLHQDSAPNFPEQYVTVEEALEAISTAVQHGIDKAKAELYKVQSLIHRQKPKAHTTTCAVHGSRACDCGAVNSQHRMEHCYVHDTPRPCSACEVNG